MTHNTHSLEPTNVERAEWARNALAVFTSETFSGDHPSSMDLDDLEAAISDLICDLLHFAHFHPRLDPLAIHLHALTTFEIERDQTALAVHSPVNP
jgi:hypothetical protein